MGTDYAERRFKNLSEEQQKNVLEVIATEKNIMCGTSEYSSDSSEVSEIADDSLYLVWGEGASEWEFLE